MDAATTALRFVRHARRTGVATTNLDDPSFQDALDAIEALANIHQHPILRKLDQYEEVLPALLYTLREAVEQGAYDPKPLVDAYLPLRRLGMEFHRDFSEFIAAPTTRED